MTLRAVEPGEKKPQSRRKRPKTVDAAAKGGDRLELLVALRERIAKAVSDPNTSARDLAALSRRLLEIANDIDAITTKDDDEGDDVGRAAATPDEEWSAI